MKKQLLNILVLAILASCGPAPFERKITRIDDNTIKYDQATLMQKHGFPVIHVKGSPYRAGLQYGVLLRDRIHDLHRQLDKQVERKVGGSWIKKRLAHIKFWFEIKMIRSKLPNNILDELRGIRDGSGLSSFEMDTIAFFPQIFFDISCTSLVTNEKNTVIHGRNLDWGGIGFLAPFALITHYEIDGEIPYLNFSYIGYPGLYTGINQEGLSLAVNMNGSTPDRDDYNKDIPLPYKTRLILSSAKNLADSRSALSDYSTHAWFLTIASDKDKGASIFELVRGKIYENPMKDSLISIANLGLSSDVKKKYCPINEHNDSNYSRIAKMNAILTQNKSKPALERIFKVLRDYSWNHLKRNPFINRSLNNKRTVQSMIFENSNRVAHFSFAKHHAPGKSYMKYDMNNKVLSLSRKAMPFFSSKKYKKIEACYDKREKCQDPDLFRIRQIEELLKDGRYPEALSLSKQYSKSYPEYYQSLRYEAKAYKGLKKYKSAASTLKRMISLSTTSPYDQYKAYLQLARLYQVQGLKTEAEKNYIQAKELASRFYLDEKRSKELERLKDILD